MLTLLFLNVSVDGDMVNEVPETLSPTNVSPTIVVSSNPTITFAPTTPSFVPSKLTTIQPLTLIITSSPIFTVNITKDSPTFSPTISPSLGEMSESRGIEELIDQSGFVVAKQDVSSTLGDMSDDDILDLFIGTINNRGRDI